MKLHANYFLITALGFALSGCATDNQEKSTAEETTASKTTVVESTVEETTEEETTEVETAPFVKNENRHWENDADISWIDPEKKLVAISFDDGPVSPVSEDSTAIRIQNALAEGGMHATFFYWGNSLNKWTMYELEMAYDKGFEIGNHTLTHSNLTGLTKEEIEEEVVAIDEQLYAVTGKNQFLLRPPYLATNQLVCDTINVPLISCAIDTQDWNKKTAEQIIDTVVKAAENGTLEGKIVLMHETNKTTAEAMEYLVPYLKEHGYLNVTVSEMFKAMGEDMEAGKVYTQVTKSGANK